MPTRITSRNYSKRKSSRGQELKPKVKKNRKCPGVSTEQQNSKIDNIFDKQKLLSGKNIILDTAKESGAIETSHSLLNAMGISVVQQSENINYTLQAGAGLEGDKIEVLTKTQDQNPNRLQVKKFTKLKNKKVSASKIFRTGDLNPVFEPDNCIEDSKRTENRPQVNVVDITNSLLDVFIPPGGGQIGRFTDTSSIEDLNLRRDSNTQTTGTGRGTTGAQGDGREGVDNAFGSGVNNRGGSF